jgi:hypothetical protein
MTGGEGGESAGTAGSGGSSAGKAGTPSTGGSLMGTSGAPTEAGEAGMGGMPHVPTLGEQCTTCGATECTDTLKSCTDSAECGAWLACLTACETSECVSSCDSKHAAAARVYSAVYDCLCTSCADDCSGADACGKKTCTDDNPLALMPTAPANLAETGLYELAGDGAGGNGGAGGAGNVELAMPIKISSQVQTFVPSFPLWADGATKERYVYIPKCSTIDDKTDMDHWKFPVGTTFWKTFKVGDTLVETRMLHRFGAGASDWTYAAYQWPEAALGNVNAPLDPSKATLAPDIGVPNANQTMHDIPTNASNVTTACRKRCSASVLFNSATPPLPATSTSRPSASWVGSVSRHRTASRCRARRCSRLRSATCTVIAVAVTTRSRRSPQLLRSCCA